MLTNQLGYVQQQEQKGFKTNSIIEVSIENAHTK